MQLSRDLKITQKTAWYILQKIRTCLICKNKGKLDGEVECDETFVGGKNKNRHKNKKVKILKEEALKIRLQYLECYKEKVMLFVE